MPSLIMLLARFLTDILAFLAYAFRARVDKKDDQITSAENLGVGGINIFTFDMPTSYFSDNGSAPEYRFGLFDGNPVLGAKFFNKLLFPYNFGDYQI